MAGAGETRYEETGLKRLAVVELDAEALESPRFQRA